MLNTIYEEIGNQDKDEKKNKKIKIKITKKDGMKDSQLIQQTLAESRIVMISNDNVRQSQQIPPTQQPLQAQSYIKESQVIQHSEIYYNEMQSQTINSIQNLNKSMMPQQTAIGKMVQSNYNLDMPTQKQISMNFSHIDRGQILFQSHVIERQDNEEISFLIPKNVIKLFENSNEFMKILEEHIKNQKLKIDMELNSLKDNISQIISEQRMQLFRSLDKVLETYKSNFLQLERKVAEFKSTQKTNKVKLKKNILVNIQNFSIFNKINDTFEKIKEDKSQLKTRIENIDSEVDKKFMSFMAEEIEKQIFHKPLFNKSENHNIIFNEIKQQISEQLKNQLQNTEHLLYIPPLYNFKEIYVLPKVEMMISDDRNSILGGERDLLEYDQLKKTISLKLSLTQSRVQSMNQSLGLGNAVKGLSLQLQAKFQTNHDAQLLCILALNDELVVTGSNQGEVKLWNIYQGQLIRQQRAHKSSITALRVFRGCPQDFQKYYNQDIDQLFGKKIEDEKIFICTAGDNVINIWDQWLKNQIITLVGHSSSIIQMISLRDQYTLVSASDDCSIRLWNTYNGQILKILDQNYGSVNALTLTKNGRLISGSSDRKIHIYKITYSYSPVYLRNVFSDCVLEFIMEDNAQIYSLNASLLDENILLSGGSDAKIKIWDLSKRKIDKEIVGHKSPVGDMILIENPFDIEKQKTFSIISVGTGDDIIRVSNSISPINNGVYIDEKINCDFGAITSPLMQIIKSPVDQTIKILVVNQSENEQYFLMLNMN